MKHLARLIVISLSLACISNKAMSIENNAALELPTNLLQINNSFKSANLGMDILYLKDTDGTISIEQILSNKTLNWQVNKDEAPNFGVDPSNFWFKTRINFDKQSSDGYLVEIAYPVLDFIDLYIFQNGKMKKAYHTGDR